MKVKCYQMRKTCFICITLICVTVLGACKKNDQTAENAATDVTVASTYDEVNPDKTDDLESVHDRAVSNIKELSYVPDMPDDQQVDFHPSMLHPRTLKVLHPGENLCQADQFVAFQTRVETRDNAFESFGPPVKAERIINVVFPTEIKTQFTTGARNRDEIRHLTAWISDALIKAAFPAEYHAKKNDSCYLSFQNTAENWLNETIEATETDYGSQGITIFPWTSNDSFVQFCVKTHSWEGGNSDMPKIKFLCFTRHGLGGGFGNIFSILYDGVPRRIVENALERKVAEIEGESTSYKGLLDMFDNWPEMTLEKDGICFWFPKGTASPATGIIPVLVSYAVLRPYMNDRDYEWVTSIKNWQTFSQMSSYGNFYEQ